MPDNLALQDLENISKQNGAIYWSLQDIANFFDYKDIKNFRFVVHKALSFATELLGDDVHNEFKVIHNEESKEVDYKISRYGVLLCAMFAADNKRNVKEVRVGLASFANFVLQDINIERIEERKKLTHGEKYMSTIAYSNGLEQKKFNIFKDAGYRGMYNMSLSKLKEYKNTDTQTIYDVMGITELAANTFRVTQTAEKIKFDNIRGTNNLISTAKNIGEQVRNIVIQNTGYSPEDLPIEPPIKQIKNNMKKAKKSINQISKK